MSVFERSLFVAVITLLLDFSFHFFLTHPMESLTYFMIKFLLAFFVAAGTFSLRSYQGKKKKFIVPAAGLIFSMLMSAYYRAWELGEAYVPFGSRAPDILGISRETIVFSAVWLVAHASFFIIGTVISDNLMKK